MTTLDEKKLSHGLKIVVVGSVGSGKSTSISASGMVVMIDNGGINPLEELDYYLKFHQTFLKKHPAVIGVTHYDDTRTCTGLIDYHNYCITQGIALPVMRLDARQKDQVERTLKRLLVEIERRKNKMNAAK